MNETWKHKTEQKLRQELPQVDERLARVNEKAMAGAGCTALFFSIGMIFYHGIRGNAGTMFFFLAELLLMVGVMAVIRIKNRDENFFLYFGGKRLNAEKTPKAKGQRVRKYLCEAALFAVICGVPSYFFGEDSSLRQVLFEIVGLFVVSFLMDYGWHEYLIRK